MTPAERDARWSEIDHELAELYDGKVTSSDPVTLEAELLAEQDDLEFDAGNDYFEGHE